MPRILGVSRWIIGAVVILAILLAGALSLRFFSPSAAVRPAADFPGSLVLSVPVPWTAPSGEILSGLITYAPATGAVSYVISPSAYLVPPTSPTALSPDGSKVLAIQIASSTALVSFSIPTQSIVETIATAPVGTPFFSPLWSPDGRRVAYVTPPSLMVAAGGASTIALAAGPALAFSPDGTMLLVTDGSPSLSLISLTGATTSVSGAVFIYPDTRFIASPDGQSLISMPPGGSATVFAIDWQGSRLTEIGVIPGAIHNIVFGEADSILALFSGGNASLYMMEGESGIKLSKTYSLVLPPDARVLRWSQQ